MLKWCHGVFIYNVTSQLYYISGEKDGSNRQSWFSSVLQSLAQRLWSAFVWDECLKSTDAADDCGGKFVSRLLSENTHMWTHTIILYTWYIPILKLLNMLYMHTILFLIQFLYHLMYHSYSIWRLNKVLLELFLEHLEHTMAQFA